MPSPAPGPEEWTPEDRADKPQCCAVKANGARCTLSPPVDEAGRAIRRYCRVHKGLTPSVVEDDPVARRRYAPFLAGWARERFDQLVEQEDILDPRQGIALLDQKIEGLMKRQAEGDTVGFRTRAMDLWTACGNARGDPNAFARAFGRLGDLLTLGGDDDEMDAAIMEWVRERTKLTEQCRRTEIAGAEVVTKARVAAAFVDMFRIIENTLTREDAARVVERIATECLEGRPDASGAHLGHLRTPVA